MAVELDDASHNSKKAKAKDAFKDGAAAAAGLRLVRIRCAANYYIDDVRQKLGAKRPKRTHRKRKP